MTTAAMIRMGKVYGNLMVDRERPTRAAGPVGADRDGRDGRVPRRSEAAALEKSQGRAKTAILMHFRQVDTEEAIRLLDRCGAVAAGRPSTAEQAIGQTERRRGDFMDDTFSANNITCALQGLDYHRFSSRS